uniref:Aquaporin 11 n=1 Tax=Takifugu rubripes TaxID=31033 RepID=H2TKG1_TAKRU
MSDLRVSVAVLSGVVLLSGACRRAAARFGVARSFLLKLLADAARLGQWTELGLCFAVTTIHLLTLRGADCNPGGTLEKVFRGTRSVRAASLLIAGQFAAAVAAQQFAASVWSLGLSDLHARHRRFGFRCFDPLGGSVTEAAAAELACAFVFQAALMHVSDLKEQLRVPLVAATVTALVYAGGGTSGAIYNPVLAFSVIFPCGGHTHLEYCFIYWLGPLLGMSSCILLFEKILPFLSGKSHNLDVQNIQYKNKVVT